MVEYSVLSPLEEMSAYEALWDRPDASFRTISKELADYPTHLASALVETQVINRYKRNLLPVLQELSYFGVRIDGDGMFPERLRDARHAPKIIYYQGNWELSYLPSVAIVGTRQPTKEGIERTKKLVTKLVEDKFVIVSGLAQGIDTAAHWTAIDKGGLTIGVIGTSLNRYYPLENQKLQDKIALEYLLISQVPFTRYARQTYHDNRFFFPARNVIMSALTQATIIVEAGETSGTLVQAKAALQQGRKLIILENNFLNTSLTWPKRLEAKGAIRAKSYDDVRKHLTDST